MLYTLCNAQNHNFECQCQMKSNTKINSFSRLSLQIICFPFFFSISNYCRGTWLVQLVEHATLDLGVWVRAPCWVWRLLKNKILKKNYCKIRQCDVEEEFWSWGPWVLDSSPGSNANVSYEHGPIPELLSLVPLHVERKKNEQRTSKISSSLIISSNSTFYFGAHWPNL